ncbi:MAG: hypothetical protein OEY01_13815 [Desulfobulbaceae bacterium]|nr:hypothetical protein [Desulfobulbaceae bacterium]HIJ79787.1 hypothetical protein [Deltaproteobacteria bacterium]
MNSLGVVKNIVEAVGMDISYAYEDLVFLEHNGFLLQFSENGQEVLVHVNREADQAVAGHDVDRLLAAALDHDLPFVKGSLYTLSQEDDENIRIEFSAAGCRG